MGLGFFFFLFLFFFLLGAGSRPQSALRRWLECCSPWYGSSNISLLLWKLNSLSFFNFFLSVLFFSSSFLCWSGATNRQALGMLLAHGGNVNLATTMNGDTALHLAAARGKTDCVRLCLEYGANYRAVNFVHPKKEKKRTAMTIGNFKKEGGKKGGGRGVKLTLLFAHLWKFKSWAARRWTW